MEVGDWRFLLYQIWVVSRTSFPVIYTHSVQFEGVSLRCVPLLIIRSTWIADSETKMLGEENNFIKKEELGQVKEGIIPLPELLKDFALVVSTVMLLFTITVAILGAWRRSIVQEDPMTTEFRELMERGNDLAKDE